MSLIGWMTLCSVTGFAVAPGPAAAGQPEPYVIGAQDTLSVTVWNEPDLSGTFSVEADGYFTFPMIGRVEAGGLTIERFETELRTRLGAGVLKNPQVSVSVEKYGSQRIFLMGEVRNPGLYPLRGRMSLIEALAHAGSTTDMAGSAVFIVRDEGRRTAPDASLRLEALETIDDDRVTRVDLDLLQRGALSENLFLADGDTVFVPRAETVFVSGNVRNAGAYAIQSGTTVLQAITLAGGVTDRGSTGRVKVVRVVDGTRTEHRVDEEDSVLPGDTIVVLQRLF